MQTYLKDLERENEKLRVENAALQQRITAVSNHSPESNQHYSQHPAVDVIRGLLVRFGDNEACAKGRALQITGALLEARMLRPDGDFLPYDYNRGIINIG